MKKKKILYLEILKILAGFAVVLIHIVGKSWYMVPTNSFNFNLLTIIDITVKWCVPIYFMISGAVFLSDERDISIKKLYTKYIPRLLLIFIFWGILYNALSLTYINNTPINIDIFIGIIKNLFLGNGIYQLWFLPFMIGLYISIPVIKLIAKKDNKKIIEYLMIILFISQGINNLIFPIFNISINYPIVFSGYLFYFISGYYLSTFDISKSKTKLIYFIGILTLILTYLLVISMSYKMQYGVINLFEYLNANIMIISLTLFLFIKNISIKVKNNTKTSKYIYFLGENYFGIYLIHGLVIGFYLYHNIISFNSSILLTLIYTLLVYITSFIITIIFKKIPYVKYLFG